MLTTTELPTNVIPCRGQGDLPMCIVNNRHGHLGVYQQGAHITNWVPTGMKPVLWMSQNSRFEKGVPIRGGIPICFPWFGTGQHGDKSPLHGLGRIEDWTIAHVYNDEKTGDTTLVFEFKIHPYMLRYGMVLGSQKLTLEMGVDNVSFTDEVNFDLALHPYFGVADITQTTVKGPQGLYMDRAGGNPQQKMQISDTTLFEGGQEVDRLFQNHSGVCEIRDPGNNRVIHLQKRGSRSTIIWNPGSEKAKAMSDFGDDEWSEMLCVEPGSVFGQGIVLEPRGRHQMMVTISIAEMLV